jgi:DNA/RNA-binding domain of Phe-tRNA-synthetase-like protein
MITWMVMTLGVAIGLGALSWIVGVLVEQRCRAERERERATAEAVLREWTRLQEAVDLDPADVVSAAERILRETRG